MRSDESTISTQDPVVNGSNPPAKKKRNLPGTPDPEAEVIALSPKTLMATNRFLCEICGKGFQRDQNLQLHRRGHNLPWKLKQRPSGEAVRKRVYVCPEKTCVHHEASRALGDLTGIKKHFCRKHGEKKWKCDKCSKRYAVQSDWKAHSKTCGTREYKCDCGTVFSRRDSFITHRAFCDALAQETARVSASSSTPNLMSYHFPIMPQHFPSSSLFSPIVTSQYQNQSIPSFSNLLEPSTCYDLNWGFNFNPSNKEVTAPSLFSTHQSGHHLDAARMSATALLQKAAEMGATTTTGEAAVGLGVEDGNKLCGLYSTSTVTCTGFGSDVESSVNDNSAMNQMQQMYSSTSKRRRLHNDEGETRDFLGVGMCHPSSINGWI